jgi:hypothetical protein
MAWLYCSVHGRGQENFTIARQEDYRQEGESVLIVHGTLTGGGWHCDRCNARLRRGDPAMLMTAFPRDLTEAMDGYDFASEGRYFDLKKVTAVRYGAAWPGGEPAAMLLMRLAEGWGAAAGLTAAGISAME